MQLIPSTSLLIQQMDNGHGLLIIPIRKNMRSLTLYSVV